MHDFICPHCHTAFKIDESGYTDIVKQVRDSQFEQQLHQRLALAKQDKRSALELARRQSHIESPRKPRFCLQIAKITLPQAQPVSLRERSNPAYSYAPPYS
jgi:hypothetical protein